MTKTQKEIAFDAEIRAIEEGHRAFVQPDGSVRVVSDTTGNGPYRVTYHETATTCVHFHCDCKSGQNRDHLLIPCKHSTLAGRRLEREGFVEWSDGFFWVTDRTRAKVMALLNISPARRPVPPPNASALCD